MTTADEARKEAEFLFWFLPKSKQPKVPEDMSEGKLAQMDGRKISFMALGPTAHTIANEDPAGNRLVTYAYGDERNMGEISGRQFTVPHIDEKARAVERVALLKLISAMTSDYVRFQFARGLFVIDGKIGEKEAAALIVPRVDDE